MRKAILGVCGVFLVAIALQASAQQTVVIDLSTDTARDLTVQQLRERSEADKAAAEELARANNLPIRRESADGTLYELMAVRDGRPIYYMTHNVNAAISTAADLIRNTSPYSVNGSGETCGIWDGGSVLSTHQEFGSRVTVMDGASSHYHATHVGGTVGASGVVASALGMAPSVNIDSYDWNSDSSEMTSRAATYAGESGKIYVSNHSYGYVAGWDYDGNYWYYGRWDLGEREDRNFGQYNSYAQGWDTICYNAPYYLPCKSSGNDRNDTAPSSGQTFYYYDSGWQSATYNPSTGPYDDGYDNGGFDCIGFIGNAKNILTVGAVNDAVSGSVRSVPAGTISTFSSCGPTDDGRVKPDVVGNGVSLYSTYNTSNTSYTTMSGTSMSSPNVAGTAMLLVDYYDNLFTGQAMRASTLKGLLTHTADDLGNAGPDYFYGWGLVNAKAAADLIKEEYDYSALAIIEEDTLDGGTPTQSYSVYSDGTTPIRATLCWTDPVGPAQSGLDDTTPVLVNDLDVQILGPGGSPTYSAYVLDGANPANVATTGDNDLDNVEQVYIASPGTVGTYTVQVSHEGSLSPSGSQVYSLLISGQSPPTVDFSSVPSPVNENAGSVTIAAQLSRAPLTGETISVQYATADGTATSPADFTSTSGTLNFPVGVATQTFNVTLIDNTAWEPSESFQVALSNPTGCVLASGYTAESVTITDNDTDTDGDRISDYDEQWYNGSGDYNPYDPDTNPTGTDLDYNDPDTDGDGVNDGVEIGMGYDPIDPLDFPLLSSIETPQFK